MFNNNYIEQYPSFEFFKGDTISIPFELYDEYDKPLILSQAELRFYLFPYGHSDELIKFGDDKFYKVGVMSNDNNAKFIVELTSLETKNLIGKKYTYQPIIKLLDETNREYIRGEGSIIFKDSYVEI